jgi:hypothetical protein
MQLSNGESDKARILPKLSCSLICPLLHSPMSSTREVTANFVLQSEYFKLHCTVPTYAQLYRVGETSPYTDQYAAIIPNPVVSLFVVEPY